MPSPLDVMHLLYFATVFAFVFGLAFGSFLNVVIYRLPQGKSVVSPRSACPNCGHLVRGYDNVPVLSWFILGGKCRDCKAPISPRYWLIELLTATLFAAVVWRFGLSWYTPKFLLFVFLLIGLIFIDADARLLPDKLTFPGIAAGLAMAPFLAIDGFVVTLLLVLNIRLPHVSWHWYSLADAVAGALAGAGLLFLVGEIYLRVRGREGMGFGDVKLMGMVGAFLGVPLTLLTIFFATLVGMVFGLLLLGVIWRKRKQRWARRKVGAEVVRRRARESTLVAYSYYQIPFGVFLGGVALVLTFFGDTIMNWYFRHSL